MKPAVAAAIIATGFVCSCDIVTPFAPGDCVPNYDVCAVKTDGTIACWGDGYHGETKAPSGRFASVTSGEQYTCGLRTDGLVACWGLNGAGQASPR
jgi:alpha-tubulin suppressor-like RCC1 family protein